MNFSSFPDLLHKSMDSLFKMCDHSEANIRMVAEENLNRVVRVCISFYQYYILIYIGMYYNLYYKLFIYIVLVHD
jgi:hypothetical protein